MFVDNAADSYDQVVENEQREGLKPLELALFVKRELEKGVSQAEIARRLGKSQTYITFVRAMIDPPTWLMDVYRSGKCRNAAQLYELRRLHEADPNGVEERVDSLDRIGSGDIHALKKGDKTVAGDCSPRSEADAGPPLRSASPPERLARLEHGTQVLVLTAKYKNHRWFVL